MGFYKIVKHCDVEVTNEVLNIRSLEKIPTLKAIEDDVDFCSSLEEDGYYLLSGGGSFLVNSEYLLVVQRRMDARVNPGKFSLFTGRSDNIEEILNPTLLARELFEELLIYKKNRLLFPYNKLYGSVLDQVYSQFREEYKRRKVINTYKIDIISTEKKVILGDQEYSLDFHVNKNKEINILFFFALQLESLPDYHFRDGEYHLQGGRKIFHRRNILLLRLKDKKLYNNRLEYQKDFCEEEASEHLIYSYRNLTKNNEDYRGILSKS